MAFSMHEDDGEESEATLAEINVTPFIDVVLVLLIVFMIAAPLATVSIDVDLPRAQAAAPPPEAEPLVVTLTAERALLVGEDSIARETLAEALDAASGGDRERRVFLRADEALTYADLMALLNDLRGAGYLRVGLVGLDGGAVAAPGAAP